MALSNSQYESIMHGYDVTRMLNSRIHEDRIQKIYDTIPEYASLDDETISLSLDITKKKILGQTDDLNVLEERLNIVKQQKKNLLENYGFPKDFLSDIYTCKDCKDTGYIDGNKCHCFIKQETEILYNQSNIREFLQDNNFSTLSHEYYSGDDLLRFTKAEEVCHNMVDDFKDKSTNLLLFGTVGTGKSFLSGCVAHELIQRGYSVIYYSAIGLFDNLAKNTFGKTNRDELYNLHESLYNCDLLIVDDLGTEVSNSFVSSELFSCINERSLRKKSTIISTNLSLEEIRDRYSDRVFSRFVSGYSVLKLTGPDIRTVKKTNSK
ncbi:MAG: ATP-binding protein [Lachnospiraceae bacterium]|nr:ATP-binding protein [Lachnospiraceae bacterium]